MMREPLRAEVTTTEHLGWLCVTPSAGTDRYALLESVRQAVGPVRLDSGAVCVPPAAAPALLRVAEPGLDWTEVARQYAENRTVSWAAHRRVREEIEQIKRAGAVAARTLLRDLDDIDVLDDHQIVNVAAMTVPGSPGLCVFDEQGSGKTVTLIFAFDLLVKRQE